MIRGRKLLGLIPARGGSKGLPGKNLLVAGGLPLIAWTITAGKKSKYIDRVVLSSDDDSIMRCAREHGCDVPFARPAALASDTAATIDVVFHALEQLPDYDFVALLQPTSPLRDVSDIDAACSLLERSGAPACVSVTAAEVNPYWMYRLSSEGKMVPLLAGDPASRRQDLPSVYTLNGAIYVAEAAWLRQSRTFVTQETVAYIMPAERSIDIDTAADFRDFERHLVEQSHGQVSA